MRAHGGARCCHNIAVFGADDGSPNAVVPFDFDQAGVVDAPYAVPAPGLGIRRVTDRAYRGFCVHNDLLPAAVAVMNEKRPEIEALFSREELPHRPARARALKYLEGFFDTIDDAKKFEKRVIRDCR